ncbi:alpha-1,2-fucosyltransferase [Helicobacter fennelliae]|uniref:Putative alpha-1,2-fucosyltransferase n=1 Tax=Helicobacter fennelliae TaxID=215 RepID=A0A2X3BAP4_9HELI|nr:alpha-1,2-fucosyltransferase [Helicobacter fennelliae]SQB97951.1 putative alpha-1,2-fucosyltransferase [Helicobacter fennelliae]
MLQEIKTKNFNNKSYFNGLFQDYRYFHHIRESLLQDFTLKSPLQGNNATLKAHITSTLDSAFLHIRRGDYLSNNNWYFVKLGSAYYNSAIRLLKSKIPKPHIFVFSDDKQWCKNHFLSYLDNEVKDNVSFEFIQGNTQADATKEMELMRSCQNAIIANSTFSWWASYLIQNPNKIIICPSRFFL